jgi:hypothetical protein
MRKVLAGLEQAAKTFELEARKVLRSALTPYWLLYLGGDDALQQAIKSCRIHPSAHLLSLTTQVAVVRRGATIMLEENKGRGARKRGERDLMCSFIAKAIRLSVPWKPGSFDKQATGAFARVLFPHIPKSIAHKSPDGFVSALHKALRGG